MFSDRDKARLVHVHPILQAKLSTVFDQMAQAGTPMFVVQGVRTPEEQAAYYAQGRTAPGPIVTNCDGITIKGPHQAHGDGWGYAVDAAFVATKDRPNPFDAAWPWPDFGELAENQGLIWGGTFRSPKDLDHVELPASTETRA